MQRESSIRRKRQQ